MKGSMSCWIITTLLLLIGLISGTGGQKLSANTYDVGCYAERTRVVSLYGPGFAYNNFLIPRCLEGGLFKKYHCNRIGCYCTYADTGRATGLSFRFASYSFLTENYLDYICNETTENPVSGCQAPQLNYPCSLKTVKYEYNQDTQTCDPIPFGCRGFKSLSDCQNQCVLRVYDACSFPEDEGKYCQDDDDDSLSVARFRHNEDGECVPFDYLGCGGNSNNYATDWECQKACADEEEELIPVLIRIINNDRYNVTVPRWLIIKHQLYENQTNEVDRDVLVDIQEYSGNITEVDVAVERPVNVAVERRFMVSGHGPRIPPPRQREQKTREQTIREGLIPHIVCRQPAKTGYCRGYFPRWFYDRKQSKCVKFVFGGCLPNGNNFRRSIDCTNYCDAPFTPSPLEEVSPPKDGAGRPVYNSRSLNTGSEIGDGVVIFQVGGGRPTTTTPATTTADTEHPTESELTMPTSPTVVAEETATGYSP